MRWALLTVLAATSCRAILGSFDECEVAADCAPKGSGLACVERLCVKPLETPLDARCTRLGADAGEALVFGSIMPRSRADGGINLTGIAREQALQLAIEQLNPPVRQGIRGRPLALLACDSQSSAVVAGELARHLVDRSVPVIFTSGSADTIAISAVTIPAGVLEMSVSASAPEISDLPDRAPDAGANEPGLVWRTASSDLVQGLVIANANRDGGVPKTAIVHINDAYGQGLAQTIVRAYPVGQTLDAPFNRGGDQSHALDSANAFAPERLVLIAFSDDVPGLLAGVAARAQLKSASLFFTDSARDPSLLSQAGAEGAWGTSPAPAPEDSDARRYFATQYQQRFNLDPFTVSATANAFDAMMCVALAAYHARDVVSGLTLARGLTLLHGGALKVALIPTVFNRASAELEVDHAIDVEGASGPLDFDDATGEAVGPIELWRVEHGAFKAVQVVVP